MSTSEPYEVAVRPDGSITVPAGAVARMGLHPGDHLRLVREASGPPTRQHSVRGVGVGHVAPEELLTWEDFEATHEANVRSTEIKYGS